MVPTQANEQEVDEDEDEDDDWEHISGTSTDLRERNDAARVEDEGDEGDMIFLGELELEDPADRNTQAKEKVGVKGKGSKSYAAVAGATSIIKA